MQLTQLANFLLQNLLQSRINYIVFFHCWQNNESLQLMQQISNPHQSHHLIFYQFVHLEDWNLENLEQKYLDHLQPRLAIYVDMKCETSKSLLNLASRDQLYNHHYHWLLHDSSNFFNFYDFFKHMNISLDADVSYIKQQISDNNGSVFYAVYDVYNNGKHIGGQLNMTGNYELNCNQTSCQVNRLLSSLSLRSKYSNRQQLRDVELRVATMVTARPLSWSPELLLRFLGQENETHIDGMARFGYQLSLLLRDMLQCEMKFIFTDHWSTGEISGGTVGAVVDQTADISSAPCVSTPGRLMYLSVIVETGYFRTVCLFRTPHNAGIDGEVFVQPFSGQVWFIFAAILLLFALALWLVFYMEGKRMGQRWRQQSVPSLLNTCLISLGAACSQSSALVPRSTGGRLTYFSLILITFIMYNYYTSVVVSFLLSSPAKSPIKTMQQLAESSLTVGLEPLSYTKSYLNYSLRPAIHLFNKRKVETQSNNPKLWLPSEEGVLRVRDDPGYVYVLEATSGYAYVERYYTQEQICDLNEIMFRPERLLYTHLHRNSTYKEIIRLKYLRMLETGVYRKHRNQWSRMGLHCYSQNFVITVGMEYVAPLFFMLICGYILVIILLMVELAWQRYMPA